MSSAGAATAEGQAGAFGLGGNGYAASGTVEDAAAHDDPLPDDVPLTRAQLQAKVSKHVCEQSAAFRYVHICKSSSINTVVCLFTSSASTDAAAMCIRRNCRGNRLHNAVLVNAGSEKP